MKEVSRFTQSDMDSLRLAGVSGRCREEIILGVARRCSHGAPQVLLCAPEKRARPFPTAFWLVCPHLMKTAARIESENGVASMESSLAGRETKWVFYNLSHAKLRLVLMCPARKRFLARYARGMFGSIRAGGVGGTDYRARVSAKCIHLQLASYLGTGHHPASAWIISRVARWECLEGNCRASGAYKQQPKRI